MPARTKNEVFDVVKTAFPQIDAATNILETSINNLNIPDHVPRALLNAREWEQTGGNLEPYGTAGDASAVQKLISEIDIERRGIAEAFGLDLPKHGDAEVYAKYVTAGQKGAPTVLESHRTYRPMVPMIDWPPLQEDLPYGLVPISSFGKLLNVPTQTCDALIYIMSVLCGIDYWKQDRYGGESITVERLGLDGLTAKEIVDYVTTGKISSR